MTSPRWLVVATLAPLCGLLLAMGAPSVAQAKGRVAIPEFKVEGDGTPALALQLQDGFVLGLVRSGIQVLDPVDLDRRLQDKPELAGCDSSACLKSIGQLLGVRFVVRVKVDVAGNSYKMTARLFSTEGSAPAVLPISTKSKSCDVCTVAEARDYMIRLADTLRPEVEDPVAQAPVNAPVAPAAPPTLMPPLLAAMGGAVAVGVGLGLFMSMPDCSSDPVPAPGMTGCDENRLRSAIAGGLIGAGAVTTVVGTYVTISRSHAAAAPSAPAATTVSVAFRY